MSQNRKKLIDLFIGNISNSVVHEILEKSIDNSDISNRYNKELTTSLNIAKRYREKINPTNSPLRIKDAEYIKDKVINKVKSELLLRISKGYKNINLNLVEDLVNSTLKKVNII